MKHSTKTARTSVPWRAMLTALMFMCCTLKMAGCSRGMKQGLFVKKEDQTMTLVSNQENTLFTIKSATDIDWRYVGKGKILSTPVNRYSSYEVKAKPDGYREKTMTLTSPVKELRFTFEISDRLSRPGQQVSPVPTSSITAQATSPLADLGPVSRRWAVIIGVAKYQHRGERLESLRYADRDARAFRDFLISEAGGHFSPSHILLLANEQATTRNLRKSLFGFLKSAIKEDLVVIYFSGHGASDPDRPENLYLLTYDTEPDDIAGTAFPMHDVKTALQTTIEAQRVVVLADACHSGGVAHNIMSKGVRIGKANEALSTYWEQLARTTPGRVIFTSGERDEVSQESAKWGGGHGVFTWSLLQGLEGAADYDQSGIVTLGEAIRYTDEKVRRETNSAQHPTVSGQQYDSNLPMGVAK